MVLCVCFWFVLLSQERKTGKERDREERRERRLGGKGKTGKQKGNRENKERKTKELVNWFKCRGNRFRFWVFMTFNDIY